MAAALDRACRRPARISSYSAAAFFAAAGPSTPAWHEAKPRSVCSRPAATERGQRETYRERKGTIMRKRDALKKVCTKNKRSMDREREIDKERDREREGQRETTRDKIRAWSTGSSSGGGSSQPSFAHACHQILFASLPAPPRTAAPRRPDLRTANQAIAKTRGSRTSATGRGANTCLAEEVLPSQSIKRTKENGTTAAQCCDRAKAGGSRTGDAELEQTFW